jgi:hypothetical protein
MTNTYIQTVYLPQENVLFLEDWLKYHISIGINHFFMYDNTGSTFRYPDKNYETNLLYDSKNKYGQIIDMPIDQALEIEEKIFSKYPVTKTIWQPLVDGKIQYNQMEACADFALKVNSGLCAFIDIDEFIVKNEEFRESRILQKKYHDRWSYKSVFDCDKTFDINTRFWGSKAILDLSTFSVGINIHFEDKDLDISNSWFNHYNHSEKTHEWLLSSYNNVDPNWIPKPYSNIFYSGDKLSIDN